MGVKPISRTMLFGCPIDYHGLSHDVPVGFQTGHPWMVPGIGIDGLPDIDGRGHLSTQPCLDMLASTQGSGLLRFGDWRHC